SGTHKPPLCESDANLVQSDISDSCISSFIASCCIGNSMVVFCSLSPKAIYPLGAMILKKPESDGKETSKEGTAGADPSLLTSIIPSPSKSATFSPLFEYQY